MTVTLRKIDKDNPVLRQYFRSQRLPDGVLQRPTVSVNVGTPATFDVTAFSYCIDGQVYTTAAIVAQVFSAIHATGIGAWLGIGLYIDANARVLTQAFPNTGDQDYGTEALALASIPRRLGGYVRFATITLLTTAADWDANTDDLNAADLAAANLLGEYVDRRWSITRPDVNFTVLQAQTRTRGVVAGTIQAEIYAGKQASDWNQMLTDPVLEVDRRTVADATVTKLRFGAFDCLVDGVLYHAEPQKQLAFTAAHPVTADKWGAILLLYTPSTGVYSTLITGATQTTTQAFSNSAAARALLPAVPAGKIAIGILVIEAKNATWTANTDDLVAASDLEAFDLVPALPDRVLSDVALAYDVAEPEDFNVTEFTAAFAGVKITKAAAAGIDFSAAHAVTASKFLAILVGMTAAGTVSTRVPLIDGRSQTSAQGFDSFDLAVAALPTPAAGVLPIGMIVIEADSGGWTANTDDMIAGSDCTNAWLVGFTTEQVLALVGAGIASSGKNALWPVTGAAFASNQQTDTDSVSDLRFQRGWADGALAIFWAAKTDAVAPAPECTVVQRPWAAGGEATV